MRGIYIKTDKNGTKYYADYTCSRCGGVGGCDKWTFTGWTCYECGGSGRARNPKIYKVYTPEYKAKLEERRAKKEAERLAKRKAEFENNLLELVAKQGIGANGKIYVVMGDTYSIKDELREAGASYRAGLNWYFEEPTDSYKTFELDYTELLYIDFEYFTIVWKKVDELKALVIKNTPVDDSQSDYVGKAGERLDLAVTFIARYEFEQRSFSGYGTDTVYINKFKDADGNIFIWKGVSAWFKADIGAELKLRGTVKEHSDYKGEKQTIIQRCKIEG